VKPFNGNPNHKSSTVCLKKTSKIKSPNNKSKGLTETGPVIKRVLSNLHQKINKEKNSIFGEGKEEKKTKLLNKLKSPQKKSIKDGSKVKKQTSTNKKLNLKTEGSFDSTSSGLFMNEVDIIGLIGQGTFGQVFKGRLRQTGEIVAIKRVLQDRKYKNREI
jgi:hypothetical protein